MKSCDLHNVKLVPVLCGGRIHYQRTVRVRCVIVICVLIESTDLIRNFCRLQKSADMSA